MLDILLLILIGIELFSIYKYREPLCPAVMHNVMWIIAIYFAKPLLQNQKIEGFAAVIIVIGSVLFQLGFGFAKYTTFGKHSDFTASNTLKLNCNNLKKLIIIVVVISVPIIFRYIYYLKGDISSIYYLLMSANENLSLPSYFSYYRGFLRYFSIGILICYWEANSDIQKRLRKYVILLQIITVLLVASVPTRNGILSYFLPLILAYFVTHKISNSKQIIIIAVAAILFMAVFYLISTRKYWYLYENAHSAFSVILSEIQTYLSGSIAAFFETASEHAYMYHGKNSFRFFIAIGDRLFGTSDAVSLTNAFTHLNNGITTNVYTFYDFYLRDFGFAYAVIAQLVVGIFHGISYWGSKKNDLLQMYYFALLSYPLVMQFFEDQYLSLLSTWIQIIVAGLLIFRTKLVIHR